LSTRLEEPVFIDLTAGGNKVEGERDEEAEEGLLTGNQSESEWEESLLMDVSSDDELEVENDNDGMNDNYCRLTDSGWWRIIGA